MPPDASMAVIAGRLHSLKIRMFDAIADYAAEALKAQGDGLREALLSTREAKDRLEALFTEEVGLFDKSGEYAADGALGIIPWLRWNCRLSGSAAAERVVISRQLEKLPETQKAFASGDLGYQHVAVIARTAEHVGSAAVRKEETALLKAAESMDSGQFASVAKHLEHRLDSEAVLAEANQAHARRCLHISEPSDGLVRLDGLLDAEGGATLRRAINSLTPPSPNDDRTPAQRRADALIELCYRPSGRHDGSGARPQLVIRAGLDTLAGTAGSPAGDLESGAPVPAETVRRLACDAALTRITGEGELDAEITRATRTIPPATRRALAARDHGCVAGGCGRPPDWTDAHHVKHWVHGGETTMANLVLLCRRHHRMVHEGGFRLQKTAPGHWALIPRSRLSDAHARSA